MQPVRLPLLPNLLTLVLGLFVLATNASLAREGTKDGGGTTHPAATLDQAEGAAWFLNGSRGVNREVKYCIDRAEDFPQSQEMIDVMIRNAVASWQHYFEENWNQDTTDQDGAAYCRAAATNPLSHQELVWNFVLQVRCTGREDLTFIFGKSNRRVHRALGREERTRLASAIRETYDIDAGWGKGFIYIAPQKAQGNKPVTIHDLPDWREGAVLHATITHELGHVFGNSDQAGTVMRSDVAALAILASDPQNREAISDLARGMDGSKFLVDHASYLPPDPLVLQSWPGDHTLRTLIGRNPSEGERRIAISLTPTPRGDAFDLLYIDSTGSIRLSLRAVQNYSVRSEPSSKQFVRVRRLEGCNMPVRNYMRSGRRNLLAILRGPSGSTLVSVNYSNDNFIDNRGSRISIAAINGSDPNADSDLQIFSRDNQLRLNLDGASGEVTNH